MKPIRTFSLIILLMMCAPSSLRAGSIRDFLTTANLSSLAQGNKVLILEAQSLNKIPQADVNAFDDFFLISAAGTLIVNFDGALTLKGQNKIPRRLGLEIYSNHDTPALDLQEAFNRIKQNFALGAAAASHVSIFKPLVPNSSFVFDYAVAADSTGSRCQEFLYVPSSMKFQKGYATRCTWTLQQFGISTHPK